MPQHCCHIQQSQQFLTSNSYSISNFPCLIFIICLIKKPTCLQLVWPPQDLNEVCSVGVYKVCLERVQPLLIYQEQFAWHQGSLAAKESGLECACVNNDDFTVLVIGEVDAVDWACVLCGHHIQNNWESTATNLHPVCVKLEYSSAKTIQMIQMATAMGN